jgi:hypothetical protein
VLVRNDDHLAFDWSAEGPDRALGKEEYSVRWEGKLKAPEDGLYQIYTVSDDGIRLWIDGKRVIDHWSSHGPVYDSFPPIELKAGQECTIRMEFFQRGGGAVARLLWTRPSMAREAEQLVADVVRRVRDDGATAVIVTNADGWGRLLHRQGVLTCHGRQNHGKWWLGGNFFMRPHPLLDGLPSKGGMNWEYQLLLDYDAERFGLLLDGEEVVVGSVSDHQPAVSTALGVVPLGKGRIVFSTFDLARSLNADAPQAEITRKLLCNYIAYAGNRP